VRAGHQVDEFLVHGDVVVGRKQPHRPAGHRYRMHIEFHGRFPFAVIGLLRRPRPLLTAA